MVLRMLNGTEHAQCTYAESTHHREEDAVVSDVCDDATDDGDQFRVVGLKGSVRIHMLDDIIQQCIHLTFLR